MTCFYEIILQIWRMIKNKTLYIKHIFKKICFMPKKKVKHWFWSIVSYYDLYNDVPCKLYMIKYRILYQITSKIQFALTWRHWNEIKHVPKYFYGTNTYEFILFQKERNLSCFPMRMFDSCPIGVSADSCPAGAPCLRE